MSWLPEGYSLGTVANASHTMTEMAIKELLPSHSYKALIKVRVVKRDPPQALQSDPSRSRAIVVFKDVNGDQIGTTLWSGGTYESFYATCVPGASLELDTFQLKLCNPKYRTTTHACDLHLSHKTRVRPLLYPIADQYLPIETTLLQDVCAKDEDEAFHVIGVLHRFEPVITTSGGKRKRTIVLVDKSQHGIEFTLWGEEAEPPEGDQKFENHPVLLIESCATSTWNSLSLRSLRGRTMVTFQPKLAVATELAAWYREAMETNLPFEMLSISKVANPTDPYVVSRLTLEALKSKTFEGVEFYGVKVLIKEVCGNFMTTSAAPGEFLDDPIMPWWLACPSQANLKNKNPCGRKCEPVSAIDGAETTGVVQYRCNFCGSIHAANEVQARYKISLKCVDQTGEKILFFGNKPATAILQASAEELRTGVKAVSTICEAVNYSEWLLLIKCSTESTEGGTSQAKFEVIEAALDPMKELEYFRKNLA